MPRVAASPIVRQRLPALVEAGRFLAHSAIRNRGTFGGSIALFDPAAEWPAACLLLDAQIHTVSPAGRRSIAADRFIQGLYKTDLDENGMIESVSIPFQEPAERSVVLEQSRRLGDFASAAVMARGVMTDTSAPTLRLVLLRGVGPPAAHRVARAGTDSAGARGPPSRDRATREGGADFPGARRRSVPLRAHQTSSGRRPRPTCDGGARGAPVMNPSPTPRTKR